jgi:hypothetical protein
LENTDLHDSNAFQTSSVAYYLNHDKYVVVADGNAYLMSHFIAYCTQKKKCVSTEGTLAGIACDLKANYVLFLQS